MKNLIPILFVSVCLTLMSTITASAYIDPGTGSMILQAIVGGVFAAGIVIKIYWAKIKAIFTKKDGGN